MKKNEIEQRVLAMEGVEALNDMQRAMIDDESQRVMLTAPTGSGKTIAFAVRLLRDVERGRDGVQAVVLAPTRELVVQIAGVLRKIGGGDVRCVALYGGHNMRDEVNELRVVPAVVVATPGRMVDHLNRRNIDVSGARCLVIDEFDKCLQLGFQDEMEKIARRLRRVRLMILTSATRGDDALPAFVGPAHSYRRYDFGKAVAGNVAGNVAGVSRPAHGKVVVGPSPAAHTQRGSVVGASSPAHNQGVLSAGQETPATCSATAGCAAGHGPTTSAAPVPEIEIVEVKSASRDKLAALGALLRAEQPGRVIVFVNHRESAERVYDYLRKEGADAVLYHGALDQQQRRIAVELLANGSRPVMVATDLAARGLDIPAIDAVVHYHLPGDAETWTHRNGRTARQGATGTAYAIVSDGESLPAGVVPARCVAPGDVAGVSRPAHGKVVGPSSAALPNVVGASSPAHNHDVLSAGQETPATCSASVGCAAGDGPTTLGSAAGDGPTTALRSHLDKVRGSGDPRHSAQLPRGVMATLYINAGKKEKISKGDVAGYVMQKGGLSREQVGRIAIDDHYALVAVPAAEAEAVVAALRPHKLKGQRVRVSVIHNS
ncbi:MAG: DEAD/DEAH box helicase [Bacteroidales bacterium]|nr:DEAD/DEAH box helicase [Bacteroidales bacterium]